MAYADFTFYTTEYGGKAITSEDFQAMANRAAAYIDAITHNAAARVAGHDLEMVKMANCALAEVFQDESKLFSTSFSTDARVSSESVGSWTRSYASAKASSVDITLLEQRKQEAVSIYLAPLGFFRLRPVKRCCR